LQKEGGRGILALELASMFREDVTQRAGGGSMRGATGWHGMLTGSGDATRGRPDHASKKEKLILVVEEERKIIY